MPVYNKRGILLLPKVIVLNPKDGAWVSALLQCFWPGLAFFKEKAHKRLISMM